MMQETEFFVLGIKAGVLIQGILLTKRVVDWITGWSINPYNWFKSSKKPENIN